MYRKMPVVSGKQLITFLKAIGYSTVRQRGSHIRMEKTTAAGTHKITIPDHNPIAKGTLNDILGKVAIWNQKSKDELIAMLK
jgi:predicted RNA binding protein YcfA (HicA-like mRNA interferase family)